MARSIWLVVSVVTVWLAPSAQAASLRCGKALVSDYASQAEVLAKCGEPVTSFTRKATVRTRPNRYQEVYEEVQIDTWFYDFGPHRFTQEVTFQNGRMVDVTSGKYGTGEDRPD